VPVLECASFFLPVAHEAGRFQMVGAITG
jgi:hypothetical protein